MVGTCNSVRFDSKLRMAAVEVLDENGRIIEMVRTTRCIDCKRSEIVGNRRWCYEFHIDVADYEYCSRAKPYSDIFEKEVRKIQEEIKRLEDDGK